MAHHDTLTGLPNRVAFNERFGDALDRAAKTKAPFAVLCIDLDRFKEINDVFGHAIGDDLLCALTARLQEAAAGAFLARLGGDEDEAFPVSAALLADRLLACVTEELDIAGHELRIGLSIGVAIYPTDGADATSLLGNADAALYRAKADCRGSVRFFEAEMDKRLRPPSAGAGPASGRRAQRARSALSATGAHQRRGHRVGGAGALAPPEARARPTGGFHPGRGGKRAHSRNR